MHGRRALVLDCRSRVRLPAPVACACAAQQRQQRQATAATATPPAGTAGRPGAGHARRYSADGGHRRPVPTPGAPGPDTPITPKPLAFGAPDKSEGEIAVKWQSNHFVKGQSGDTYVPFTISVDKGQLSKGAALYVRIVSAEQAAAFATTMAAAVMPQPAQSGGKPARQRLHGHRSSGTASTSSIRRMASCHAPCSSSPDSTSRSSP